jgi:two-component system NarL family response regulator
MSALIKLMVVDDHPSLRHGFVSILAAFDDQFAVVAEAANVKEALLKVPSSHPDVVVTDLHFGQSDPMGGIDLIHALRTEHPQIKIVLITGSLEDESLLLAHDAGAHAFLGKEATAAEIAKAIDAVSSGFTHFPSRLREALQKREREPRLSDRESQIIPLIAAGMTAKQIAIELARLDPTKPIVDRTVEIYKGNIKRKFGLKAASALISFCMEYSKRIKK